MQNDSDREYLERKLLDKIYIWWTFSYEEDLELSWTKAKYISKVLDRKDSRLEMNIKWERVIRITPWGKQQIRAIVLTDGNQIKKLNFQRYSIDPNNPHKINFTFDEDDIWRIRDLLNDIELFDLSDDASHQVLDEDMLKFKKLMTQKDKFELVEEILASDLTDKDVVAIWYRKQQLNVFDQILNHWYFAEYKKEVWMAASKDETVWQYFFASNPRIFWYWLDYRFNWILQKEFSWSDPDLDWKNEVIWDFLLWDNKFTTFVEIKKPGTNLFWKSKNRSNARKLSEGLFDSVSQILEQKSSWQIKIDNKPNYNEENEEITQWAYDSKVVLLIGNWLEIQADKPRIKAIKEKTFELFRRDSRNIDVITYDELYERAKFIVDSGINENWDWDTIEPVEKEEEPPF